MKRRPPALYTPASYWSSSGGRRENQTIKNLSEFFSLSLLEGVKEKSAWMLCSMPQMPRRVWYCTPRASFWIQVLLFLSSLASAEPESCFQDTADHVRASQCFWHRHDLRPSAKDPPADPWTLLRTQCEQAFSLRWPPLVRNSFPGVIRLVSA